MDTTVLLTTILFGGLAAAGIGATIKAITQDGYRQIPTDARKLQRLRDRCEEGEGRA